MPLAGQGVAVGTARRRRRSTGAQQGIETAAGAVHAAERLRAALDDDRREAIEHPGIVDDPERRQAPVEFRRSDIRRREGDPIGRVRREAEGQSPHGDIEAVRAEEGVQGRDPGGTARPGLGGPAQGGRRRRADPIADQPGQGPPGSGHRPDPKGMALAERHS